MQIYAMIVKEIKVLFRNRLLLFSNVFLPVLVILVNLLYTNTATINVKIGFCGDSALEQEIIDLMDTYNEEVKISFLEYDSIDDAFKDCDGKSIDCIILRMDDSSFTVYYDSENTKSEVGYQYFTAALRDLNAKNYSEEMISMILSSQKYMMKEAVSISNKRESNLDKFVWVGFVWIFLYSNLSLAITQMQQERATKTILYICKVKTRWEKLFLSKLLAAFLHYMLILATFIITVVWLGLSEFHFKWNQIPLFIIVFVCISSIGHLLGSIINNSAFLVVIQMFLVFPLMLINAFQTSHLDKLLKSTPVYCAMEIAKNAVYQHDINKETLLICIGTSVICYLITVFYLMKREPIKICKIQ